MYFDFLPALNSLPLHTSVSKELLFTTEFQIYAEHDLVMYYSPHNDYVNKNAKIVIVGITPGWLQMKTAFEAYLSCEHQSLIDKLQFTKETASYAGTMRANLIAMLDEIGLHKAFGLSSCTELFANKRSFLHTTSLLKYPVFYKGKNYTGHNPSMKSSKLLTSFVFSVFPEELKLIDSNALIIPLGKIVDEMIKELASAGKISQPFLTGFPHPSGANGHRLKQLAQEKNQLIKQVSAWKNDLA